MLTETKKEWRRWRRYKFTFALSENALRGKEFAVIKETPIAVPCASCGSVRILGPDERRSFEAGENKFCDIQCAGDYKRWHNRSEQYRNTAGFVEQKRIAEINRIEREWVEAEARKLRWACCDWCWKAFERKTVVSRFCSGECQYEQSKLNEKLERMEFRINNPLPLQTIVCEHCGKKTEHGKHIASVRFCDERCRRKSARRNRRHKERTDGLSQSISITKLLKKYKGRCALCGIKCTEPDGLSKATEATIDHIHPLSKGGLHIWTNVQLLCRQCNCVEKNDGMTDGMQMMLPLHAPPRGGTRI